VSRGPSGTTRSVATARNLTRGTVLAERVEVADSFGGRFMGLMGRRALPAGDGLWLTGGNGIHMFFMRFPIDALFLGREAEGGRRTVVGLRRGLRPWTGLVPLVRGADGVLELPAGTIEHTATALGDAVSIG
jgi:hypothetical protein